VAQGESLRVCTGSGVLGGLKVIDAVCESLDYWKEVGDNPYLLPVIEDIDTAIDPRQLAKNPMLMSLNAGDEKKAFKAFRWECAPGTPEKKLTDKQVGIVLSLLQEKHKPVAHRLTAAANKTPRSSQLLNGGT
jgi:hypothetical protein